MSDLVDSMADNVGGWGVKVRCYSEMAFYILGVEVLSVSDFDRSNHFFPA